MAPWRVERWNRGERHVDDRAARRPTVWGLSLGRRTTASSRRCPRCAPRCATASYYQVMKLFSFISQNWRGKPLVTDQVIVSLIAATTTKTGLLVRSRIDSRVYAKGRRISDQQLAEVHSNLTPSTASRTTRSTPRRLRRDMYTLFRYRPLLTAAGSIRPRSRSAYPLSRRWSTTGSPRSTPCATTRRRGRKGQLACAQDPNGGSRQRERG